MNAWFDMVSYTAQYMAGSIEKKGLALEGKPGDVARLGNGKCTIRLSNVDNDFVSFEFWEPGKEGEVYGLTYYLDCAYAYRGLELNPNLPRSLPAEEQFVGCLRIYDRLLLEGYLDVPLSGDFGWVAQYHASIKEVKRLRLAWSQLEEEEHPEAHAIWVKKDKGDPTWMDDVRRILGEVV